MIREKRRRQRLLKKVLIGVLVFMILAVISVFVVVNVFVVNNVEVEGNELYDEQLITNTVLNDEYSWNSLYVLLKYTFVDIKDVPFIDEMEISLLTPQTVKIKVYEKGMLGYIYISAIGENAYFDKDGFVVETSTRIIEGIPKIEGIVCNEVVLYEKLPVENQLLRDILTLTQALKRADLDPDMIHFEHDDAPVLYYGDTEVWLGSTELLTQKVARIKEILPTVKGVVGILHMENWTEESANIIFEKLPEKIEEEPAVDDENTTEGEPQDSESDVSQEDDEAQDTDNIEENQEQDVSN